MLKTISELQGGAVWSRSKNGVPLAGPGMKASINDLRAEDHDVDSGKGLVPPAVKRQRTGLSPKSPRCEKSPYCYAHGGGKRCVIHSTFDPSRGTSGETSATVASTPFVYRNDFQRSFDTPSVRQSNTADRRQRSYSGNPLIASSDARHSSQSTIVTTRSIDHDENSASTPAVAAQSSQ